MATLLATGVGDAGLAPVLRIVRNHLGMDIAFVARFRSTDRVLEHVDADGAAPIAAGQTIPLHQGYCLKVVQGELPQLIPDTSMLPEALAIPETHAIPIGAHIGVPVMLENGDLYGTLCCFSRAPNPTLGDRDMNMLRAFAEVVALHVSEHLAESQQRQRAMDAVWEAIAGGAPRIVYQPIYALDTHTIVGVECLSRFDIEPLRGPEQWFNVARAAGVEIDLELHAIYNAIAAIDDLPAELYVGINSSPALILSGRLAPMLAGLDGSRLVLEITEHATVPDYDALLRALHPMRERGVRVAVDDAGAGFASMRHILHLKCDIIKLDMSLTRDIDRDPSRRALARGLISFASDIGSDITAEGVETRGELDVLRDLGVTKAQGYYLSKPGSLADALTAFRTGGPAFAK